MDGADLRLIGRVDRGDLVALGGGDEFVVDEQTCVQCNLLAIGRSEVDLVGHLE